VAIYKNGHQSDVAQFLVPQGYVLRGGSVVNSIFVDGNRVAA
jgi:hypothetical protein